MNTKLLIGLGAVAAVVLLGVFVVSPLLLSDDGADEQPAPAAAAEGDAAQGEGGADDRGDPDGGADDPDDRADDPDPVDETFEVFTARDPFQQLVTEGGQVTPASTSGGDDDDGGDDGGDDVDDDGDDEIASVDDDDGDDGGDGGEDSDASVGGTTVELIEVFEDTDGSEAVQVTVNGTGYEVGEGEDFAGRFRVLDIDGQCATFLFGDQRFTLCEGETIRK